MKLSQRKIRFLSRLLLVAGLFAQGTLAAHACVLSSDVAVNVHAMETVAEAMPCHMAESGNANACLIHCTQDNQVNLDQHSIFALPMTEAILHVAMPQIQHKGVTAVISPVALNIGPSLSIRFCSFLI
jgi:hypothetical protein